jgi:hypothetical protein
VYKFRRTSSGNNVCHLDTYPRICAKYVELPRVPHFYSRRVASVLTLCDRMRGGSEGKRNVHSRPRSVGGGRSSRYEERRAAQHGGRSSSSSSYAPEWSDATAIAVMQQLQEGRRAAGERISAHVRRVLGSRASINALVAATKLVAHMVYTWAVAIQYMPFVRSVMSVYIILKINCKLQNMLIAYRKRSPSNAFFVTVRMSRISPTIESQH